MRIVEDQRVCHDCIMFLANGDLPEDPVREEEILFAVVATAQDGGDWVADGTEEGFSWRRCDCCGSRLGGDRYSANIIYHGR